MRHKKAGFSVIWKTAVTLLLLFLLFRLVPWPQMWEELKKLTVSTVLLASLCVFGAVVCSVIKWGLLLQGMKRGIRWRTAWQLYWSGYFLNQFAPGGLGADGYRVLQMKQVGLEKEGLFSVLVERILAIISLGALGVIGYFFCQTEIRGYLPMMAAVFTAGSLLLLLTLGTGRKPKTKRNIPQKLSLWLDQFALTRSALRENPAHILAAGAATLAFHFLNFLLIFVLLSALNPSISFVSAWVLNAGVSVLSMIPISINGHGIREFAYLWIGGAFALEKSQLVAASLLFAFFVLAVTLYGGIELLIPQNRERFLIQTDSAQLLS